MTTSKELSISESALPMLSPDEVIQNATVQAKLLMDIVEQTKCYQQIRDKKYLQVEAWETIGAFNRTHAETEHITPLIKDGETIGYEAKVQLFKDGFVIGGAIMPCYFSENACKGKTGDAKHKASMSAAQTFATSKAYRMNFSYVAILAGYQPTPAEEMTGEDSTSPDHAQHHWCKNHKTAFFKKGKMKTYAHPVKDADGNSTGEWCNEPEAKQSAPAMPKKPSAEAPGQVLHPQPDESEVIDAEFTEEETESEPEAEKEPELEPEQEPEPEQETEPPKSPIALDWLKEQIKILGWTNAEVHGALKAITGKDAESVTKAVNYLTAKQATAFVKEIQDAVDTAIAK